MSKKKPKPKSKLTPKQRMFVKEYLVDLNAAGAARRAGYSPNSADVIGCENLAKPNVAAAIQRAMDKRAEKAEITADRVLQEIALPAFLDPARLFDASNGGLLPINEMPDDVRRAIASLEIDERRMVKRIKLVDKKGSLELLGRHLKLFTDKTEHAGPDGGPIENKWIVEIREANNAKD